MTGPAPLTERHVASGSSQRLVWADVARGCCVLLVVLHHLVTKHHDLTLPPSMGGVEQVWTALTTALKPLRMPLFFTLSGLFAAASVRRPWRDVVRRWVLGPYYLYAVWLTIHAVIFSVATTLPMNRSRDLGELALDLAYASTGMWYLYALPVYFVLLKVLHRSRAVLFVVALGMVVLAATLPIEAVNRVSVLQNFVYFAAAATAPSLVRRTAEGGSPRTVALVAGYAATGGGLLLVGAPYVVSVLVLSLVAVPVGLRAAEALSRHRRLSAPLAWLGRRTLPVYVLHVPLLALLHHAPNPLRWAAASVDQHPFLAAATAAIYPVVASSAITAGCLVLWNALAAIGLGGLFRRPRGPAAVPVPGRGRDSDR